MIKAIRGKKRETKTNKLTMEQPVKPHDGIYNTDILNNPGSWYIPKWSEFGFASTALATRKGQTAYKNKSTGVVVNAMFDSSDITNILDDYDPLRQYKIADVPKLNTGSLGVQAWFKFNSVPEYLKGLDFISPVYADRNLMQYILHQGLDYNSNPALKDKQEVRCVYDGVVIKTSYDAVSGYYVVMQHTANGHTFFTAYMHLKQPTVPLGITHKQGDVIGHVGNTGSAKGLYSTHLHFEMRDESYTGYLDPIAVIGIDKINKL